MDNKKILYISQEISPYMPETAMAKLARNLPQSIQELGDEVRIFMPRYGLINERRNQLHEVIRLSGLNLIIDDTDHPLIIKVASITQARIQVYFVDNDDFFKRKSKFSGKEGMFKDNDERSIFFIRGSLEAIKQLRWIPDVVHCTGAFSALTAIYLKKMYHDDPCFSKAKVVYSIYDEPRPVELPETLFKKLAFDKITEDMVKVMDGKTDANALHHLACEYADGIIQGSETLNDELAEIKNSYVGKKPVLDYQDGDPAEAYRKFYDEVLEK